MKFSSCDTICSLQDNCMEAGFLTSFLNRENVHNYYNNKSLQQLELLREKTTAEPKENLFWYIVSSM